MKEPELEILINDLETRGDMTLADYDGVVHALTFLLPKTPLHNINAARIGSVEGALLVADEAYPNWAVNIHGQANDRDGHWRCTLRENDSRDDDAVIGAGRSPILSQAILAALLRLSAQMK